VSKLRRRFWLESAGATITGLVALTTLIRPDWIEFVFNVDPDEGSGALEWTIVAIFAGLSVAAFVAARLEWRRIHLARSGG
jgi:hypothetical protein